MSITASILVAGMAFSLPSNQNELIACGWDHVTPEVLVSEYDHYESLPFDGVSLQVYRFDNRSDSFEATFGNTEVQWSLKDFDRSLVAFEELNKRSNRKLTRNYLSINANPGGVDWFDDRAWAEIESRFRIAGQLVRRGELAGIIFDPEPYDKDLRQFVIPRTRMPGRDFEDFQVQAATRGRALMRAFAAEAPRAKILCYYWLSAVERSDSRYGSIVVSGQWYELMPAFAEGFYAELKPEMRIIDGNEAAYHYNRPEEFALGESWIRKGAASVLSKEGQERYRRFTEVGHGLYVDAHLTPEGDSYFISGLGGKRVWRLGANLQSAQKFGDGTVWLWCEEGTWNRVREAPSWEKLLPGITEQFRLTRQPSLIFKGARPNLILTNESAFSGWQSDDSKGDFIRTEEGLTLSGVSEGCWIYNESVLPGQLVGVRARVDTLHIRKVSLDIRWKDSDGQWLNPNVADRSFAVVSGEAEGIVRAPIGAKTAVILLSGRLEKEEAATFRELRVWKVD